MNQPLLQYLKKYHVLSRYIKKNPIVMFVFNSESFNYNVNTYPRGKICPNHMKQINYFCLSYCLRMDNEMIDDCSAPEENICLSYTYVLE